MGNSSLFGAWLGKSAKMAAVVAVGLTCLALVSDGVSGQVEANAQVSPVSGASSGPVASTGSVVALSSAHVQQVSRDPQSDLEQCCTNVSNLSTALEMYAFDNDGAYPESLAQLTDESYLLRIPECPAAGQDTYSSTYTSGTDPDSYAFCCRGNHHQAAGIGTDYPRIDSEHRVMLEPLRRNDQANSHR